MLEETKDQVQTDSSSEATGPRTIKKDQAPEVQSETTEKVDQVESKKYKISLPDGEREMTPDELYDHYQKIGPEFTRRSQELAELKRQKAEFEEQNKRTAEEAVSQNKLLADVDPTVRDAIVQIVSPVIQEALTAKEKAEQLKREQEAFDNRMTALEKKYPGKFNKMEILREMQRPGQEIFDPEKLYQTLHWDDYLDEQIKLAMKGKAGVTQTESTSTEAPRKPGETKSPSTWGEASKNAYSRI